MYDVWAFSFLMFRTIPIFRMMTQSCQVKKAITALIFSFYRSYRYHVIKPSTLIGLVLAECKGQQRESLTDVNLMSISDLPRDFWNSVAQVDQQN